MIIVIFIYLFYSLSELLHLYVIIALLSTNQDNIDFHGLLTDLLAAYSANNHAKENRLARDC